MTNFERYRDEILKIVESSAYCQVAIKDGKPVLCEETVCAGCELDKEDRSGCVLNFMKWGYEDDDADCSPDASKPKGGCEGCHYEGNHILNMPCCQCERAIMDCFEPKKKPEKKTKTRQDEFLKMYPNALKSNNILMICPVEIESDYGACETYSECRKCKASYWFEEVE